MNTFNANKNLTIFDKPTFHGLTVLNSITLCNEYLESIQVLLNRATEDHPRTLIVRFDLHFPINSTCPDNPYYLDTGMITKFFSSLANRIKWDSNQKIKAGKRSHPCTVRYVWARERKDSANYHYHVALLLNKDRFFCLGNYRTICNNLAGMIIKAWASALALCELRAKNLVYFPDDTPCYYLNINADDYLTNLNAAFCRLSYLAKLDTKVYGDRTNNFSCSRR